MNRLCAKLVHEVANSSFWMENEDWSAGSKLGNIACHLVRSLPFSIHELQKRIIFAEPEKITVSGESIVYERGDTVDKFMFRYPKTVSIEQFQNGVENEINTVLYHLGGLALSTQVSLKDASIFKKRLGMINAVTQTQPKLDLAQYPNLNLDTLSQSKSKIADVTIRDLEILVKRSDELFLSEGLHPDFSFSSGNLRVGQAEGDLKLIDIMPIHQDGTRLIGDQPSKLPHAVETLQMYRDIVGTYGS